MLIAFPTNDKKTIAKFTGRCEEFAVYKIENNIPELLEYRKNTHEHHDHSKAESEDEEHNHNDIMEKLSDIDLLIIKMAGKHFRNDLDAYSIKYEKSKELDINIILESYK